MFFGVKYDFIFDHVKYYFCTYYNIEGKKFQVHIFEVVDNNQSIFGNQIIRSWRLLVLMYDNGGGHDKGVRVVACYNTSDVLNL